MIEKFVDKTTKYSEVDWNNLAEVADLWQSRILGWWFEPLDQYPITGHEAFPVLASCCVVAGEAANLFGEHDEPGADNLAAFYDALHPDLEGHGDAFRERVHHSLFAEGHLPGDAAISGTGRVAIMTEDDELIIDPWKLRDALRNWILARCLMLKSEPAAEEDLRFRDRLREALRPREVAS